jgi:BTB/POZ domain
MLARLRKQVRGVEFRAHKSVLVGYRCFLGSLMSSDMKESRQSFVELTDMDADPELFRCLLDYMYGKVSEPHALRSRLHAHMS